MKRTNIQGRGSKMLEREKERVRRENVHKDFFDKIKKEGIAQKQRMVGKFFTGDTYG